MQYPVLRTYTTGAEPVDISVNEKGFVWADPAADVRALYPFEDFDVKVTIDIRPKKVERA